MSTKATLTEMGEEYPNRYRLDFEPPIEHSEHDGYLIAAFTGTEIECLAVAKDHGFSYSDLRRK